MPSAGDFGMCLGDINGHIGRHIGFNGIEGGYGASQRTLKGAMMLTFCLDKEL